MTWPDSDSQNDCRLAIYNPKSDTFTTEPAQIQKAYNLIATDSIVTTSCIEQNNSVCITWADISFRVWFVIDNKKTKNI